MLQRTKARLSKFGYRKYDIYTREYLKLYEIKYE